MQREGRRKLVSTQKILLQYRIAGKIRRKNLVINNKTYDVQSALSLIKTTASGSRAAAVQKIDLVNKRTPSHKSKSGKY